MVQEEFVKFYMPLLAKAYLEAGVRIDPKKFIGAVWKGYEAMVKNDGSQTNREAFWSYIDPCLPVSRKESEALADAFYDLGSLTGQSVQRSDRVVRCSRETGKSPKV